MACLTHPSPHLNLTPHPHISPSNITLTPHPHSSHFTSLLTHHPHTSLLHITLTPHPHSSHLHIALTPHPSPSHFTLTPHPLLCSSVHLVRLKQTDERFAMKKVNKQRMLMKKQVPYALPTHVPPSHSHSCPSHLCPTHSCPSPSHLQVDQVFHERDILTYAENPFVVGFLCTFQTKVRGACNCQKV